jgi:hypothetical protein
MPRNDAHDAVVSIVQLLEPDERGVRWRPHAYLDRFVLDAARPDLKFVPVERVDLVERCRQRDQP